MNKQCLYENIQFLYVHKICEKSVFEWEQTVFVYGQNGHVCAQIVSVCEQIVNCNKQLLQTMSIC